MTKSVDAPAIAVYTTPTCMQCRATFRWLDKRGFEYTAVDVSTDLSAHDYVRKLGYTSAPVVALSNGEHWHGFRPELLAAHLS